MKASSESGLCATVISRTSLDATVVTAGRFGCFGYYCHLNSNDV